MDLDEALKRAKESVQAAGLPSEWEVAAFRVALQNLLGGLSSPGSAQQLSGSSSKGVHQADGATDAGAKAGVQQFATRVKVSVAALEDVYGFEDDTIRLHVASSKIASSKSKAARDVSILLAAARQGTGVDDGWTASSHIRETLTDYGRLDSGNFASSLKSVTDAFNFRGKGVNVEVRLTQPGWEVAAELVRKVAGVTE